MFDISCKVALDLVLIILVVLVLVLIVLVILVLVILIILGLPAKLHGTSAQGTAHLQCVRPPQHSAPPAPSFASGLVIVE
jgi:hypothetical protein